MAHEITEMQIRRKVKNRFNKILLFIYKMGLENTNVPYISLAKG
jgi:hypothetical protein